MIAALEFLALHVEYCARCTPAPGAPGCSSCGTDGAVPSVDMELLLCSAVLPALEENLAVGIGDMVGHAPLFAATLDLIHAFTLLPAPEAHALLGPAPAELVPTQRRPLRALLAEADALVAEYLASLGSRGCGGVAVFPNDVVVADQDGAVLIPQAFLDHVLAEGPEQERMEAWIVNEVNNGAQLPGLYPMNADTKARYAASKK